jgi:hypothetical protein
MRIVFSTAKFIARLKMEKMFCKGEKVYKNPFRWEWLVISEQNILYRNRRLKIIFQRCCASQNKT